MAEVGSRYHTPTPAQGREICALYRSGLRLKDVARQSGFCVTTVRKVMSANGCVPRRRGKAVGSGPVREFDDVALVAFKKAWDRLSSPEKGTIAEGYAKNRLAELGFDVWEPFSQNHKTDIIVLSGASVRRLQVKSATYDTKIKAFRANVTRGRRGGKRTDYALSDVDFFVVYCGGLEHLCFYVIPAALVIGRADLKLYPHRDKGSDRREVVWEAYRDDFAQLRP